MPRLYKAPDIGGPASGKNKGAQQKDGGGEDEGPEEENLETLVECPVCLEQFQDPRILPCLHTLCYKCLADHIKGTADCTGAYFQCPTCREGTTVPPGGPINFPKNFFVNKLSDILSKKDEKKKKKSTVKEIKCAHGTPELPHLEPVVHCAECGEHFCQECTEAHQRFKALRDHTFKQLTKTKTSPRDAIAKSKSKSKSTSKTKPKDTQEARRKSPRQSVVEESRAGIRDLDISGQSSEQTASAGSPPGATSPSAQDVTATNQVEAQTRVVQVPAQSVRGATLVLSRSSDSLRSTPPGSTIGLTAPTSYSTPPGSTPPGSTIGVAALGSRSTPPGSVIGLAAPASRSTPPGSTIGSAAPGLASRVMRSGSLIAVPAPTSRSTPPGSTIGLSAPTSRRSSEPAPRPSQAPTAPGLTRVVASNPQSQQPASRTTYSAAPSSTIQAPTQPTAPQQEPKMGIERTMQSVTSGNLKHVISTDLAHSEPKFVPGSKKHTKQPEPISVNPNGKIQPTSTTVKQEKISQPSYAKTSPLKTATSVPVGTEPVKGSSVVSVNGASVQGNNSFRTIVQSP